MSCFGRLEANIEIKAPPSKFHEMFHKIPHHVKNASSDKIQGCELHDSEWGEVGSIICWNYFHDGKARIGKQIIEAVDEEKNLIVARMIEGDLLENHKTFKFKMQAFPKGNKGSLIHWILEYDKVHENIEDPYSMLEFVVAMSKDIDAHLMESN